MSILIITNNKTKREMKKYLFMLFALCAVAFTACSDDDDDSKVLPVLDPNNTDVYINAEGGEASVTVKRLPTTRERQRKLT